MIPVGEVITGTLVFLDCGCSGIRGIGPIDGPVLVTIERPCETHSPSGTPQLRYMEQWELVSPFSRPAES